MMRRILTLAGYFAKSVLFSPTGLILLILGMAFWAIFFSPGHPSSDLRNYIILIAVWGAFASFLMAVAVSGRASRIENTPFIVRLPSRIEYLAAVLLSSLILSALLQLLVAGLALIRGPEMTAAQLLVLPAIWIPINLLAALLALHATDLVTDGWSRVILFGLIAIALIFNSASSDSASWFSDQFAGLAAFLSRLNLIWLSDLAYRLASWVSQLSPSSIGKFFSVFFWPFRTIAQTAFVGQFSPTQALAPSILMLYNTVLFLIASILFAEKDLEFTE